MTDERIKIEYAPIDSLKPADYNPRKHSDKQAAQLRENIEKYGLVDPVIVNSAPEREGVIIGGHFRVEVAKEMGFKEVPVVKLNIPDIEREKELNIRLNKNTGEFDFDLLASFDPTLLAAIGFTKEEMAEIFSDWDENMAKTALKDDYLIPPFSIWDTRQKYFKDRANLWKRYIGADSREGRAEDLMGEGLGKLDANLMPRQTGTSEFNPVVAEIGYRWFCPKGGVILDPFAGGVVRGAVAAIAGYEYHGVDISAEQVKTNREQWGKTKANRHEDGKDPVWYEADSREMDKAIPEGFKADMILSCPPYYDLEQYTDNKSDLSNAETYEKFLEGYREIIKKAVARLKENRFAFWVVGEIRGKDGFYRGLVRDTIKAYEDAGMKLYNEMILVNSIGTAPVRARRPFDENRKVTKVHQNILVFVNGKADEIRDSYQNMPQVAVDHRNVLVFYNGDLEQIRKDFVIDKGIGKQEYEF